LQEKLSGINSVREALNGSRKVHRIYVLKERQDNRLQEIIALARTRGIKIEEASRQQLEQLAGNDWHQGVVARVEAYPYVSVEDIIERAAKRAEPPFIIILDGLEDPQNLGAIIRTAECAGVHGVIIPKDRAVDVTPAVVRASAGAVEHIPVARVSNLVNVIKDLKKQGMWVIGADMNGSKDHYSVDIPRPVAIVIGSEGKGIRRLVKENCDLLLRIPLRGRLNSLNASVAAALLIYEVLRQDTMNSP